MEKQEKESWLPVAPFKEGDFDHALPDVAVGCGGVEAVLSEHVGVELGDGYHGRKVVVELRSEVSGAASDAMPEILLALDLVLCVKGKDKSK
mgnify:CR=1 FL=1